jgi:hypothetical protein
MYFSNQLLDLSATNQIVDQKIRCTYNMSLLVIEKCRKLEQLFEKNLQNFETLN